MNNVPFAVVPFALIGAGWVFYHSFKLTRFLIFGCPCCHQRVSHPVGRPMYSARLVRRNPDPVKIDTPNPINIDISPLEEK